MAKHFKFDLFHVEETPTRVYVNGIFDNSLGYYPSLVYRDVVGYLIDHQKEPFTFEVNDYESDGYVDTEHWPEEFDLIPESELEKFGIY